VSGYIKSLYLSNEKSTSEKSEEKKARDQCLAPHTNGTIYWFL